MATFGFSDAELEGHNISALVPPPYCLQVYPAERSPKMVGMTRTSGRTRNGFIETNDCERIRVVLKSTEINASDVEIYRVQIDKVDPSIELVISTTEDGTIQSSNSFADLVLGYSIGELLHQNIGSLIPRLVGQGVDGSLSITHDASSSAPATYGALHKDGSIVPIMVHVFKILDAALFSCHIRRQDSSFHHLAERAPFADLTLGPEIGRGKFGVVRLCTSHSTKQAVEIKVFRKDEISEFELPKIEREIANLTKMDHPNIACLYKVVEGQHIIGLVMEHCQGGTLSAYVKHKGQMQEDEARHYFAQIVGAISYVHSKHVIHRDIKTENILLTSHCEWRARQIKVIDFGLSGSTLPDSIHTSFCGTPAYAAPEMLLHQAYYGPSVDVWSMGVVLFEMLVGCVPFQCLSAIVTAVFCVPVTVSEKCANLMRRCIVKEPQLRITVSEISHHDWLTGNAHSSWSNNAAQRPGKGVKDSESTPSNYRKRQRKKVSL